MDKHIFHYNKFKDNNGEELIALDYTDENILILLKENPSIGQEEIGQKLHLSQASISVRINNLKPYLSTIFTKKYIILNELRK